MDELLKHLVRNGVSKCGSYEPEEVMVYIEEYLTAPQYAYVFAFLTWVSANNRTFGSGNIDAVVAEFDALTN